MAVPKYDELFNPTLEALQKLGGSGTVAEIEEEVAEVLGLSEEEINEFHRGNRTKLSYRLAWTRNYLKRYGLLENSTRGVWALTSIGQNTKKVDKDEVNRTVKALDLINKTEISPAEAEEDSPESWQEKLVEELQKMDPSAFERLCQRILRESGFVEVEVTGKSGDGGIDGKGILKLSGLLSFHIIFQCKRYSGAVPSKQIRDFRGAMVGRTDKGLFITTGRFTKDARNEAMRDGAPPIDLIDGAQLSDIMKSLGLGVKVEPLEDVEVDKVWIDNI